MPQEARIASGTRHLDLAVIIPSLDKYGGAERLVIECVQRWQKRHKVTLYASAINDRLLEEHGVGTQVKRVRLSPYYEGEHAMLLNTTLLPRIWQEEIGRHELYHAHLWPTHLIDLHPMVWYPHEPFRTLHDLRFEQKHGSDGESAAHIYPKYDYDRFGDRQFAANLRAIAAADQSGRPDRIVANSKYTAGYLSQVYGREVSEVVYPGAEPAMAIDLPRDPNLFVTVGQLWAHKRTRLLIEALSQTDEAQLMVIGSGPDREWLEEMAERIGVSDRVFFLANLTNRELELILARASALLFAAIREPFGIVVLEAMAAGLPVIAANEGGYSEVCTPESAFLVAPSPGAFAEKIRLLQRDPDLRDRMGAAGRRVAAEYTWTRTATELEQCLLAAAPSATATADAGPVRTLVGAQYYLWYGEGYGERHWNDDPEHSHVSDRPALGYYGSTKGETIRAHLGQFEGMGLDYAILNLHVTATGPDVVEWRAIQHLFDIAEADGTALKFAVQIAPYADDPAAVVAVVERVYQELAGRKAYLHLGGKPLLFWFWSAAFDRKRRVIAQFERASAGFTNVAAALRLPVGAEEADLTQGLFRGFAPFSPLELAEGANLEAIWSMGYRMAEEAGMAIRVVSVSPGYDDQALVDPRRAGNPRRVVPRQDGALYKRGLDWMAQLDPPPHLVMVSTFNEFHENSHIEATARHGQTYVRMTRDAVDRLQRRKDAVR